MGYTVYHHSFPFHTISVPGFPGSLSLRRRSLPFRHFRASPCSADDSSILQATKGGRGGLANTCLPKINCRLPIIRMNMNESDSSTRPVSLNLELCRTILPLSSLFQRSAGRQWDFSGATGCRVTCIGFWRLLSSLLGCPSSAPARAHGVQRP